ncbi:MAG: hypothetical protein QOE51_615, partial [Actinoplanes sp.]|nr:hypothetical protein [Actinoplanes sp.]
PRSRQYAVPGLPQTVRHIASVWFVRRALLPRIVRYGESGPYPVNRYSPLPMCDARASRHDLIGSTSYVVSFVFLGMGFV